MACRNGGIVSVIGVYGGFVDKFPMGAVMNRSLTIRTGPVPRAALHAAAARADRDGARSIRASSSPTACRSRTRRRRYEMFLHKQDDCVKVVLSPNGREA